MPLDRDVGRGKLRTIGKSGQKKIYELVTREYERLDGFEGYHEGLFNILRFSDPQVYELIGAEYERLRSSIQLIAAENRCSRAVLAALGSVVQNKTTEGFPGARFHGGCEVVDEIERLAVQRVKEAFGAEYANVQPHSGTSANHIILTAVLNRDDKVLSLGIDQGGHVSHGAAVSFTGKFFNTESYYVDPKSFLLDYDAIRDKALKARPKLIICGATAYSRTIDFQAFRQIADEVGAYLLADISHIAGLVMAGVHPSPVNCAHFTTTSTYKPGGPRGGLIIMGRDKNHTINVSGREIPLWKHIEKTTFPGVQGTPYLNNIAAKAVFFKEALSEQYRSRQFKIVENARRLASSLLSRGHDVLTGGTDNHMVLINVSNLREGLCGRAAQQCLERCGIIVNMNRLPYDRYPPAVTSGIRLGTPVVTRSGMGAGEMDDISAMIDEVLRKIVIKNNGLCEMDESFANSLKERVRYLCDRFPLQ